MAWGLRPAQLDSSLCSPYNQGGDSTTISLLAQSSNAHIQLQLHIETDPSCHRWVIRIKSVAALVGLGSFSCTAGACTAPTCHFKALPSLAHPHSPPAHQGPLPLPKPLTWVHLMQICLYCTCKTPFCKSTFSSLPWSGQLFPDPDLICNLGHLWPLLSHL